MTSGSSEVRDEYVPLDPIEVEKKLLEEQTKVDPMDSVYTMYGLYLPKFKEGISTLRHGQKNRLLNALVEYPITETTFDGMDDTEKEIFNIGNSILQAKFIMFMDKYNEGVGDMLKDDGLTDEQKKELDGIVAETTFETGEK
jgi:hypothetical protein